jgi:hypothetical protein
LVSPPIAEAKRVQVGDRPRAHGENVAQDPADPGCRTLIGLDVGGVVVALHLEDGGIAVADVDDAGILARAADHPRGGGRQLFEVNARGFIGAMLRPHDRKDAKLGEVRLPSQCLQDAAIFVGGQAVLGDLALRDLGHAPRLSGERQLGQSGAAKSSALSGNRGYRATCSC